MKIGDLCCLEQFKGLYIYLGDGSFSEWARVYCLSSNKRIQIIKGKVNAVKKCP